VTGYPGKCNLAVEENKLGVVTAFFPVCAAAIPAALQQLNFHEISLEYLLQPIKQMKGLLQGKRRATMWDKRERGVY
jgi:hypothetical protein